MSDREAPRRGGCRRRRLGQRAGRDSVARARRNARARCRPPRECAWVSLALRGHASCRPMCAPTSLRFVDFFRALGEVVVFPTHDAELNALARHADELPLLAPFPSWDVLERVQSKRAQLETAQAAGVDIPARRPVDVPRHRQAGPFGRVQAALQAASVSLRDAGGARRCACEDGRVRTDRPGLRPGRRRHALHGRELHRARRPCARRLLGTQAAADAAGHRDVPRRRGRLGARRPSTPRCDCSRRSATSGSRRSSSSATRATAASS